MKLTQDQINFIDAYLIKNKVRYWDVRMELLYHIATDVQLRMQSGQSFDIALKEVHLSFGNSYKSKKLSKDQKSWIFTESIYADNSGFNKLIKSKHVELHKSLKKDFKGAFINFFTSPFSIGVYLFLLIVLFYLLKNHLLEVQVIFYILLFSLLLLSLLPICIAAVQIKSSFKSLYIASLSALPLMNIGIFNGFQLGLSAWSSSSQFNYSWGYVLVAFVVLFPFVFVQLQVFFGKFRNYQKIHKMYFT